MTTSIEIREVRPEEHETLGRLMVADYASLEGFPTPEEQPDDYQKLSYIGRLNDQPDTQVLVALSAPGQLVGGVVYFSDMAVYGSGGRATAEKDASGIRLLGVDPRYRQAGVGRALTEACIRRQPPGDTRTSYCIRSRQCRWPGGFTGEWGSIAQPTWISFRPSCRCSDSGCG